MRRKVTGSILAAALIMCTMVSGVASFVPAGKAATVEAAADKSDKDKDSETKKDDDKKEDSKSEKDDDKKDDSKSEKDNKKDDSKSEKDNKKDDSKSEKDDKKDDSKSEKDDSKKDKDGKYSIETKKMTMYYGTLDGKQDIELSFINGADDVPYISVDGFRDLYVMMLHDFGAEKADLKVEKNGAKVTLSRESGYPVVIDFAKDTIDFHDYDAFMRMSENQPLLDTVSSTGFNDKGEPEYFQLCESSFDRYGDSLKLKPGDYGIDLVYQNGEYYLPVQLVSDIFMSEYQVNTLFNTKALFLVGGGLMDDLEDEYYIKDAPKERSDALIDFNYKELCFALDNIYGLKAQHQIDKFDDLFANTGLIVPLHSKNPEEANQALSDLLCKYFDDGHSGGVKKTYMTKEDPKRNWGPTRLSTFEIMEEYEEIRKKAYPDGPEPYEEVGNTAFITFDQFLYLDVDYYGGEKPEDNLDDTVGLMLYSYDQITRKDSPIENVVLDLSYNGGGMADAAAFVLGTFLGEGSICMSNPTTGALCSETLKVDLNLDRKFDDKDSLRAYKLFCIESPNSFSCGNLVPSAFKSSHKVTLLGQTSGGGACVVHRMSTADGALFQMSGPKRLAYMKNGSFYDIDQGAAPDFVIPDPALLYDRKYMADYVNNILGK